MHKPIGDAEALHFKRIEEDLVLADSRFGGLVVYVEVVVAEEGASLEDVVCGLRLRELRGLGLKAVQVEVLVKELQDQVFV